MDDKLEVVHLLRQKLDHVAALQAQVLVALQSSQPPRHAAREVVPHRDGNSPPGGGGLVEVQCGMDEIIAEKPRASCDKEVLARHPVELITQVGRDVVEVLLKQILERLHCTG